MTPDDCPRRVITVGGAIAGLSGVGLPTVLTDETVGSWQGYLPRSRWRAHARSWFSGSSSRADSRLGFGLPAKYWPV